MVGQLNIGLDFTTLVTGTLIFFARVTDVSMGTMRTISIVHGLTRRAFFLGLVEVTMWLIVISTVVNQISSKPILGFFYAFGFSAGNVVGIMLERRLACGDIILRVISIQNGNSMATRIRQSGYPVTTFQGEGMSGPVTELYVVCRRRDLNAILSNVKSIEPEAFYITEQAGSVSKIYRPSMQVPTGWRAVLKMK